MAAEPEGSGSPAVSDSESTAPRMSAGVEVLVEETAAVMKADVDRALAEERAEADRELMEGPRNDEAVDIRDEGSQKNFDQMLVSGAIQQLRQALAQEKLNYHLAKLGIGEPGKGGHPEQVRRNVKRIREQLALLIEYSLSEQAIPEPSDLEVATSLPSQGEAQKLGLA